MFKRKNFISLAVSVLLCGNVYASTNTKYLPLTTDKKDNAWVLFGVTGFSSSDDSITNSGATAFNPNYTENSTENNATKITMLFNEGLPLTDKNGQNMGTYKAELPLTDVKLNIDFPTNTDSSTEPFRTMYLDINGDGAVDLSIKYKTSLEGRSFEIKINGNDTIYRTVFDFTKTFQNKVVPIVGAESITIDISNNISSLEDVLDYNLSNNPLSSSLYNFSVPIDEAPPLTKARFYTYDSVAKIWKIWE